MSEDYIRIKTPESSQSDQAFHALMKTTETILNDINPVNNLKISASDVEIVTLNALKEATKSVSIFTPDDIILVSGLRFPDIEVRPSYGVEVKTSHSGWCSIGSSIIESTRVPNIELIYMVFGNLKNMPPLFKCREYDRVLTDIKVTHSPRYSIDMETTTSVFDEMGMTYDTYRNKDDEEKIKLAQLYVREKYKSQGHNEMPWWIKDIQGNNDSILRIWSSLSDNEKMEFTAQCMILFPEVLNPKKSNTKYYNATLWLCTYHQVVTPFMRDLFTSGGKVKFTIRNENYLFPKLYETIKRHLGIIKKLLEESEEVDTQLKIYNRELFRQPKSKRYDHFLRRVASTGAGLPVMEYLFSGE